MWNPHRPPRVAPTSTGQRCRQPRSAPRAWAARLPPMPWPFWALAAHFWVFMMDFIIFIVILWWFNGINMIQSPLMVENMVIFQISDFTQKIAMGSWNCKVHCIRCQVCWTWHLVTSMASSLAGSPWRSLLDLLCHLLRHSPKNGDLRRFNVIQ